MAMTSPLLNNATLLPETALQRFQQQGQRAIVNDITSTVGAEGVGTQSTQESVDQVQLSPAARQAFAAEQLPAELIPAQFQGQSQTNTPDAPSAPVVATTSVAANNVDNSSPGPDSSDLPLAAYQRQVVIGQSAVKEDISTTDSKSNSKSGSVTTTKATGRDSLELSPEAQQQLMELAKRDQEVKVHEAAHAAVGGRYAGAPQLSYETGPDGKRYAVSGEVSIDMSEIKGDPAATMQKADIVRAAALAPAQPSTQDRNVAAKASQMKLKAHAELLAESEAEATAMVERSHRPAAAGQNNPDSLGTAPLNTTTRTDNSSTSTSSIDLSAYTSGTTGDRTTSQPRYSSVI